MCQMIEVEDVFRFPSLSNMRDNSLIKRQIEAVCLQRTFAEMDIEILEKCSLR
eukprot:c6606_g1_i1 orf=156-314(+)